ncbi:MAG TPA: crosslink repair DNA glycosylase YcaQ family protein [Frankiaceae bacterium]|nr:crosslink repair DNA glycosylase YcaQ family protein [Frankiaceae bacterium]
MSSARVRERLSAAQVRRAAVAATGLGGSRPQRPDLRQLRQMVRRLNLVQIDSVNVLARAHYLPGWSRLGAYDPADLDRLAYRRHELFEYWAHEASLVPVELEPLLRWRKAAALRHEGVWGGIKAVARARPDLVAAVLDRVRDEGARSASDFGDRALGSWWGWSDTKRALEFLFWSGQLDVTERRRSFERVYDLPERVLPAAIRNLPTPSEGDARRELLLLAARAHGVGSAADLADYFRQTVPTCRPLLAELVGDGSLLEVEVEGWEVAGYVLPDLVVPRRVEGRALLAPFDPLVWERPRVRRIFGFDYRIEIYVPAEKRRHGYYVLPFLLGDRLVARVDLKADRQRDLLWVRAVHGEPGAPDETGAALAVELRELAEWLGLSGLEVTAVEGADRLTAELLGCADRLR